MQPFQIFKAGRHVAMSGEAVAFGAEDLRATVAAYDPALHEAPIVVGHPRHDQPAYGWIGGLGLDGEAMVAAPRQVDQAFADLVREGRFKKVSASFYRPDAAGNPKPGVWYLRHVGFLGAQPPSVKGLRPVELADGEEGVVEFAAAERQVAGLFRRLREFLIERFGAEDADRVLPAGDLAWLDELAAEPPAPAQLATTDPGFADPAGPQEEKRMAASEEEIATRQRELDERAARLEQERAAFAEAQRQARRREHETLIDRLMADGRVTPGQRDRLLAFMDSLDAEATISFGEAKETQIQALVAFLGSLPRAVDLGELAPAGSAVDTSDPSAIARAAIAFQEAERAKGIAVTTDRAVRHVLQETR